MARETMKAWRGRAFAGFLRWLATLLIVSIATPLLAQSTSYSNTSSGAINDLTCGTGGVLNRTFTVNSNVLITDVNIGIALLHTYRSDLRLSLTSPAGTTVALLTNAGGSGDNLNDLFDDGAAAANSAHDLLATDSTSAAPPYSHSYRPTSPLSAFNGQNAIGTWTLSICDSVSVDVGTFTRSDLYITGTSADLSLAVNVSSSSPTYGTNATITLVATSAPGSTATATGVTVSDVLPNGLTFVSATGTGTYTSGSGLWSVGSLSPGSSASLTITVTASAAVGSVLTNTAQITASSQPDPDSTVNNGVTSEDDYASSVLTIGANVINCPSGSTATGSGYASSGSSSLIGQIFWFDWSCGGTTLFNAGATINKTWSAGDGLTVAGQISGLTQDLKPYVSGTWSGDTLQLRHAGLNPIGLSNKNNQGEDPYFNLTLSGTINGSPFPMRFVLADAEDSGGVASSESIQATTTGSSWSTVETFGSISVNNAGNSTLIYDPSNGGGGTATVETTGTSLTMGVQLYAGGATAAAFGILTPYDFSDAPLTGKSYGSANHRTLLGLRLGAGVTAEASPYDSANASGDVDDGVVLPSLFRSQAAIISVSTLGPGMLSAWIDYNGDGDFADAGEQVATNAIDGGSGDSDGVANGTIALSVTPPAGAITSATIARFRLSASSNQGSSGLAGFGEVEDYQLSVINPSINVTKTRVLLFDQTNGSNNPKEIPGATIQYCVTISNTGSASASNVTLSDSLPGALAYVAASLKSGSSCAGATIVEDDDATGGDESDPFGASASGSAISGSAQNLMVGETFALTYSVLVN